MKKKSFSPTKAKLQEPAPKFSSGSQRTFIILSIFVVVIAAMAAYHNSYLCPFVFDDDKAITQNPTIRHLCPLNVPLSPPHGGVTVAARPLLNLSFAVNYAISNLMPWSYHLLNLIIHILSGLLLFGIVRRTLLMPLLAKRFGASSAALALITALLWVVHPLQTESVTYISQRAESLMSMFYLITFYCFIRAAGSLENKLWFAGSIIFCLCGMACKEVMATAPVMILLYDRVFTEGTFREALKNRRWFYTCLAATWLLLAYILISSGARGESAGYGTVTVYEYLLTQCKAIVLYLKLSLWPHPLVIDYGTDVVKNFVDVFFQAMIVIGLVICTLIGFLRKSVLGFLGAWFFIILAPSSSFVPVITQTMAEHRMYLPLAAIMALAVTLSFSFFGKKSLPVFFAIAIVFIGITNKRNSDYKSEFTLWNKTVTDYPSNARAHCTLGYAMWKSGNLNNAAMECGIAVRLNPRYAKAHCNIGCILSGLNRYAEAIEHCREAIRLEPDYAEAYTNWGIALAQQGLLPEAISRFDEALRLEPNSANAHDNLGTALVQSGRLYEAVGQFREALSIDPNYEKARMDLQAATDMMSRMNIK